MSNGTKRRDKNRIVLRPGQAERPNGTYWFRWVDLDGKRRAVYAKTLSQLRLKEEHCKQLPPKETSINDQFNEWIGSRRDFKLSTMNLYKTVYELYIKDRLGNRIVSEVRRSDIRKFIINIAKQHDISVSRAKCIHSILSQMFDLAIDDEIVESNPCDGVMDNLVARFKPRGTKHALMQNEQEELLRFVKESDKAYSRLYPLFVVLSDTGMRIGQALSLTWKDVDLQNGLVHINKTVLYLHGEHVVQKPKTKGSVRTIPLTNRALDILAELKPNANSDIVFANKYGTYYMGTNINKELVDIVNDYNSTHCDRKLPHISCHTFRHTYATKLNAHGVNIKCAQSVLGHSNIRTTMDVYTDISQEMVVSEIKKLTPNDAHLYTNGVSQT